MGRGWRRVSEGIRQAIGTITPLSSDEDFEPTSNARNEAMFREATEFSALIKVMERDLASLQKHLECQFVNVRNILVSPLPRVYEMDGRTQVESHPNTNCIVGQGVDVDRLTDSLKVMNEKIGSEVFDPLYDWLRDFKKIQADMKKLESMRLELDSRRRTVGSIHRELNHHRAKTAQRAQIMKAAHGGAYVEDYKMAQIIRETDARKSHKEEKMMAIHNAYYQREQTVFEALSSLINSSRGLREYAASSFINLQELFNSALTAFDDIPSMNTAGAPGTHALQLTAAGATTTHNNQLSVIIPSPPSGTPTGKGQPPGGGRPSAMGASVMAMDSNLWSTSSHMMKPTTQQVQQHSPSVSPKADPQHFSAAGGMTYFRNNVATFDDVEGISSAKLQAARMRNYKQASGLGGAEELPLSQRGGYPPDGYVAVHAGVQGSYGAMPSKCFAQQYAAPTGTAPPPINGQQYQQYPPSLWNAPASNLGSRHNHADVY